MRREILGGSFSVIKGGLYLAYIRDINWVSYLWGVLIEFYGIFSAL